MQFNIHKIKSHHLLFTVALLGLIFYVVSPLVFPAAHGLRQPELLPVYTLMLGLGQIVKGNTSIGSGGNTPNNNKNDNSK